MKKFLIIISLLVACSLPLNAQDFPTKDVSPEAVMNCLLAKDIIKELNEDALIQANGLVNNNMSEAARATIWMYLEINRKYYSKYTKWVNKHCKEI